MKIKNIILLFFLTIVFSFLIFFAKNYFFGGKENLINEKIEEIYIEPVAVTKIDLSISSPVVETVNKSLNSAVTKINYTFVPKDFGNEKEAVGYRDTFDSFLSSNIVDEKLSFLDVLLQKEKEEVRGRMQNKTVKLFGLYYMKIEEFLAVGIHEFAHFFDLYILTKVGNIDKSDYFYHLAWDDTQVVKQGLKPFDFVSGYAMTNKYEDFAETFTYYVLHNSDFVEKTKKSEVLKRKYDFFRNYIFGNGEFVNLAINTEAELKDYYRDITKIGYSLEKLLQYLKKGV